MIAPFVLILVGMNLAVPVRCYETPADWQAHRIEMAAAGTPIKAGAGAYLHPRRFFPDSVYVALSPQACRSVRKAETYGGWILGHEFGHVDQDINGRPFSEPEADRFGDRNGPRWQRRLARYFKIKPKHTAVVTIGP
jgi:hypothetical protein